MSDLPKVEFKDDSDKIYANKLNLDLKKNIDTIKNQESHKEIGLRNFLDETDKNQVEHAASLISEDRKNEIRALALEMVRNNEFENRYF